MCFVRLCAIGSAAIAIADLLSVKIDVGPEEDNSISLSNWRQNNTVAQVSEADMYSASAEESAGVRCSLENQ